MAKEELQPLIDGGILKIPETKQLSNEGQAGLQQKKGKKILITEQVLIRLQARSVNEQTLYVVMKEFM